MAKLTTSSIWVKQKTTNNSPSNSFRSYSWFQNYRKKYWISRRPFQEYLLSINGLTLLLSLRFQIERLQNAHAEVLTSKEELAGLHRIGEKEMKEAVAHCEHQLDRTRTENSALQRELHARQEVLDSLNETVVIKVLLNSKRSQFFLHFFMLVSIFR